MEFAVPQDRIGEVITSSVKALLESRRRMQGRFTDTEEQWGASGETGPFTSMQGIRTVLGAITALAEDQRSDIWETVEQDLESIFEEWRTVLSELQQEGYGARPYDFRNALAAILKEDSKASTGEAYVDTLSWSMSTSVLFNHTARILKKRNRKLADVALVESTRQELGRSLTLLLEAQCDDGGWSWAKGAEAGHLYFTWSAVEGLADYYDYILGESEAQIGVAADDEAVTWFATNYPLLRKRMDDARQRALEFLVGRYLAKALEQGLTLADLTVEKRIEPIDAQNTKVVVYFELYLLESLILLNYDLPRGVVSLTNREHLAKLYRRIAERLVALDALPRSSDSFWSDPNASTLRFHIFSKKRPGGMAHLFAIQDPGLWPQFLRTMILYRYYTDPSSGPDAEIIGLNRSALRFLVDDRRPSGEEIGDGLWDTFAFNLAVSSRSIEALIDVYDYYQRLAQTEAAQGAAIDRDLSVVIADAVFPHLAAKLTASLPEQQPVPAQDIDATELERKLKPFVLRKDFSETLMRFFEKALYPLQVGGPPRDQLLVELLSKRVAEQLQHDNSDAHKLLGQLVWLNFGIVVRLLPLILAESSIFLFTQQDGVEESVAKFREVEAQRTDGHERLEDRLKLALQEMMTVEVAAADTRPGDPPSYTDLVRGSLSQPPASKGKAK